MARTGAKGKVAGQAIAITTLTPVRDRAALARRMWLVRCAPGFGAPLARLAFIFFGRWTIVDELPGAELKTPYLLFESNYDGSWADYLDAFADHIPERLKRVWDTCYGFEEEVLQEKGRDGRPFKPAPFKRYVAKNELEVLHFYSAYPDDTTRTVTQALALADRLRRKGLDETARLLALGPVPERRGLPVRVGSFLKSWLRMVTKRYTVRPLTLAVPILPERLDALRDHLLALKASPLARVPGTHFARLVLIRPELLDLGQPERDVLDSPYLLLTSNHDGPAGQYLRAMAREADGIWDACAGYPGSDDPEAFAHWLERHCIATRYFVTGFPARPVEEVKAATDQRRRIAAELSGTRVPAPSPGVSEAPPEPARSNPWAEARETFDDRAVQGLVLRGYGVEYDTAWYGLLRVQDARVLRTWLERVSFTHDEPKLGDAHLNLAFTYAGLEALGAPEAWLEPLPREFYEGAAQRADTLGDRADSASETWEFGRSPSHVLAIVHAKTERARDEAAETLKAELDGSLVLEHEQRAAMVDRDPGRDEPDPGVDVTCASKFSREHFGFADGCSQPSLDDDRRDDDGNGVKATRFASGVRALLETWGLKPKRYWRGVAPGEFVLGYVNEDGEAAPGSESPLCPDGTFMVYRKLEQDVRTFEEHTGTWAEEKGLNAEKVRAWVVGRWRDGTPLTLSPDGEDAAIANDRDAANVFDFSEDQMGARCPFGAHIRRTNPRDDLPAGGEGTMRHRIIRRGMPYGDARERGLMFVCFGASISRGFETVQRAWCDTGFALGLGAQPDYLLQQRTASGEDPIGALPITADLVLPPPPKPFVTVRGTEYLLMPGRSGLAALLG